MTLISNLQDQVDALSDRLIEVEQMATEVYRDTSGTTEDATEAERKRVAAIDASAERLMKGRRDRQRSIEEPWVVPTGCQMEDK